MTDPHEGDVFKNSTTRIQVTRVTATQIEITDHVESETMTWLEWIDFLKAGEFQPAKTYTKAE